MSHTKSKYKVSRGRRKKSQKWLRLTQQDDHSIKGSHDLITEIYSFTVLEAESWESVSRGQNPGASRMAVSPEALGDAPFPAPPAPGGRSASAPVCLGHHVNFASACVSPSDNSE